MHTKVCLLLAAAMMFVAAGAFAADETPASAPSTQPSTISKAFEELDQPEPAVRERARHQLMGLRRPELEPLREIVQKNRPLAPAQAAVLREIVVQVFLSDDPYPASDQDGFLGVMLEPVRQDGLFVPDELTGDPSGELGPGVLVRECMPGFAGFRFLRAGDVVRGVLGAQFAPTSTLAELKAAVRSTRPGQILPLQVLRQGQLVEVEVRVSARPREAVDEASMRLLQDRRMSEAEAYWQKSFAPLVEEAMSSASSNSPARA